MDAWIVGLMNTSVHSGDPPVASMTQKKPFTTRLPPGQSLIVVAQSRSPA